MTKICTFYFIADCCLTWHPLCLEYSLQMRRLGHTLVCTKIFLVAYCVANYIKSTWPHAAKFEIFGLAHKLNTGLYIISYYTINAFLQKFFMFLFIKYFIAPGQEGQSSTYVHRSVTVENRTVVTSL